MAERYKYLDAMQWSPSIAVVVRFCSITGFLGLIYAAVSDVFPTGTANCLITDLVLTGYICLMVGF